jgi:uncharacterized protein
MRITEIDFGGAKPIDGYGPGFFRVGSVKIDGAMAMLPSGPVAWAGFAEMALFVDVASGLDVVLVGTGAEISAIPVKFRDALVEAGIGVEFMATPSACRTYNVLLSEGRRVGAALVAV